MDNMLTVVPTPDQENLVAVLNKANIFLDQARTLAAAIKDDSTFSEAGHFRVALSRAMKEAQEELRELDETSKRARQVVIKKIKESIDPFEQSLAVLDPAIAAYDTEQKRKRQAEEERLRKEQQRQADEAQLAAATEADKSGDHARAEAILEQPMVIPAPRLAPMAKVKGMSFRENWEADAVVNLKVLAKAVVEGKAPLNCIMANMPVLNTMARALKQSLNIPGVKAVCEKVVASRKA